MTKKDLKETSTNFYKISMLILKKSKINVNSLRKISNKRNKKALISPKLTITIHEENKAQKVPPYLIDFTL